MTESKITKQVKAKMKGIKHLAAVVTKNEDGMTVNVSIPEEPAIISLSLVGMYNELRKKGYHQLWKSIPEIAKLSK